MCSNKHVILLAMCAVLYMLHPMWGCVDIQQPVVLQGRYCVTEGYVNKTNIMEHHRCKFLCVTSPETCAAASYNTAGRYCILVKESCWEPEQDPSFIYTQLQPRLCNLIWVPYDYYAIPHSAVTCSDCSCASCRIVGRVQDDADLLIGYGYAINYVSVRRPDMSHFYGPDGAEVLTLQDPNCTGQWQSVDPTDPLPEGAVQGGHIGGSPLYVGHNGNEVGYFYPETLRVYGYSSGSTSRITLLIVA